MLTSFDSITLMLVCIAVTCPHIGRKVNCSFQCIHVRDKRNFLSLIFRLYKVWFCFSPLKLCHITVFNMCFLAMGFVCLVDEITVNIILWLRGSCHSKIRSTLPDCCAGHCCSGWAYQVTVSCDLPQRSRACARQLAQSSIGPTLNR